MSCRNAAWMSVGLAASVLVAGGCRRPAAGEPRDVPPGVLVLRMPSRLGKMRRPPVEFDHDKHTRAESDCRSCHLTDRTGKLLARFRRVNDGQSYDGLKDFYHDKCLDCHRKRGQGARGCGECHAKRPRGRSLRASLRMDLSLHGRHTLAYGNRCEPCHHVLDKKSQQLVYKKGTEDACASCHTRRTEGRRLSLRLASHRNCVNCHLQRKAAKQTAGPVRCAGCHTRARQARYKRLDNPPRLLRGQKDLLWVKATGGKARRVMFDHKRHEGTANRCSACHHRSLAACDRCHTLTGDDKKGGGVTLEQAYHATQSTHSCVGCHGRVARQKSCAGCHQALPVRASRRACAVCHKGPEAGAPLPPLVASVPSPGTLPAYSKAFPEWVTIKSLAKRYQPSRLPHGKIVRALYKGIKGSSLANRFHGGTDALCAGCHHQARRGARPTSCASCHTRAAHPTRDKPGLKAAYHRQCMGCHTQMGLAKHNTCNACHKPARGAARAGGNR